MVRSNDEEMSSGSIGFENVGPFPFFREQSVVWIVYVTCVIAAPCLSRSEHFPLVPRPVASATASDHKKESQRPSTDSTKSTNQPIKSTRRETMVIHSNYAQQEYTLYRYLHLTLTLTLTLIHSRSPHRRSPSHPLYTLQPTPSPPNSSILGFQPRFPTLFFFFCQFFLFPLCQCRFVLFHILACECFFLHDFFEQGSLGSGYGC